MAYYFVVTTMITVGFGDISPVNEQEYLLCIITMLFTCGVFAFAINTIGVVFEDLIAQEKQLKDKMSAINQYMIKKKIPSALQYQIRQFLEYNWKKNSYDQSNVKSIISNLSLNLREKLLWGNASPCNRTVAELEGESEN